MQEHTEKYLQTKTIVIKIETYQALKDLKIIPQDPFDSVIKRILDQNKNNK